MDKLLAQLILNFHEISVRAGKSPAPVEMSREEFNHLMRLADDLRKAFRKPRQVSIRDVAWAADHPRDP